MPQCKISLRKSVQAFTCRVRQLGHFIISQGLQVPEPDSQHALTIEYLVAAYPSEPSDDITRSPTEHIASAVELIRGVHREQTRPRVDEVIATRQDQPLASEDSSFLGDEIGNYAWGDQRNLPIEFDVDWMLGLTNSDNPRNAFDMDSSASTTFAGLANYPLGSKFLFGESVHEANGHHDVPAVYDNTSSDEEDHKEVTGQIFRSYRYSPGHGQRELEILWSYLKCSSVERQTCLATRA